MNWTNEKHPTAFQGPIENPVWIHGENDRLEITRGERGIDIFDHSAGEGIFSLSDDAAHALGEILLAFTPQAVKA